MRHVSTAPWIGAAILACALGVGGANAQTRPPVTLAAIQTTFDAASARITDAARKQEQEALAQYGRTLDALLPTLRQKGDLTSYLLIEQEVKRFKTDKCLPVRVTNAFIAKAVASYQDQVDAAETETTRQRVRLLRQYIAALTGLVKNLVVQNKVADAMAADVVKRQAESALAEEEALLAPPPDPPADADTTAKATPPVPGETNPLSSDPAPPDLPLAPPVSFIVNASSLGSATEFPTSMQAEKGQWIVIAVSPLAKMSLVKRSSDNQGKITFRLQGGNDASDTLWINSDKFGGKSRTAFLASSKGRVHYTTSGSFSARVTLTTSNTRPDWMPAAEETLRPDEPWRIP